MSIEYLGLSSINGPLIALEGVQGAFFDEIVEFVIGGSERKIGRIIELYEDKAVIQVFEGSENMSLKNTHTRLTGHPMEIALSPDMLGRTFNGIGGVGKTIFVGDLAFENLKFVTPASTAVCAVRVTRASRGAAAQA